MGKFNPGSNSNIYQELQGALPNGEFATAAYFNGAVYYGPVGGTLRRFTFSQACLDPVPAALTSTLFAYPGVTPSISSSGNSAGIVWAYENPGTGSNQAVLHAYDAAFLTELYNSNQNASRAWRLSGDVIIANVSLGFASLDWEIAEFGDFTGTGRQDILWRNTDDGSVDAWIMDGFTIVAQWFPSAVSLDWQIRATPDVNGNGMNSIFWSNVSTGQQAIWASNGSAFVPGAPFAIAPPAWVVQPTGG